jgi:hypothetical protein
MRMHLILRGLVIGTVALTLASSGCKIVGDDGEDRDAPEQQVEVSALPLNVTAAVKGVMPNGVITEAEKETRKGKMVYSLDVKDGAKEYDVIVSPEGQILETKQEK